MLKEAQATPKNEYTIFDVSDVIVAPIEFVTDNQVVIGFSKKKECKQ